MNTRIDVALEFSACVRRMNGVVLDDLLVQPDFENADYWFPDFNVVAELKCLTEDLVSNADFKRRTSDLYASWIRRRLVPKPTRPKTLVNLRDLPLKCAREFLDPIKRKLETSTIRKANRQLRETKKHFGAPNAKGQLLLVNDGNYMLPPTMMTHLLSRLLKTEHTSISSVTYFSVNEVVSVPGMASPSTFWIDAIVPGREPSPLSFRSSLQESWMRDYSTLVPVSVVEYQGSTVPSFVDLLAFHKGDAA